jgi:hypothetical protein
MVDLYFHRIIYRTNIEFTVFRRTVIRLALPVHPALKMWDHTAREIEVALQCRDRILVWVVKRSKESTETQVLISHDPLPFIWHRTARQWDPFISGTGTQPAPKGKVGKEKMKNGMA